MRKKTRLEIPLFLVFKCFIVEQKNQRSPLEKCIQGEMTDWGLEALSAFLLILSEGELGFLSQKQHSPFVFPGSQK